VSAAYASPSHANRSPVPVQYSTASRYASPLRSPRDYSASSPSRPYSSAYSSPSTSHMTCTPHTSASVRMAPEPSFVDQSVNLGTTMQVGRCKCFSRTTPPPMLRSGAHLNRDTKNPGNWALSNRLLQIKRTLFAH
jgi:hypothetical protein